MESMERNDLKPERGMLSRRRSRAPGRVRGVERPLDAAERRCRARTADIWQTCPFWRGRGAEGAERWGEGRGPESAESDNASADGRRRGGLPGQGEADLSGKLRFRAYLSGNGWWC